MTARTKYSRTYHLPESPGATSDDKRHSDTSIFTNREVVVTEKMDGENTTIYADGHVHARALDSKAHKSRDWVRSLAADIGRAGLPSSLRICGENLYARHSIHYNALNSYFYVFGVYDGNQCLSWNDTVEWCDLLGLFHVPVLYRGPWNRAKVQACWTGRSTASPGDDQEGYVVRLTESFPAAAFPMSSAKFVRPHHVQTDEHWMYSAIVPNRLR